jgi:hypothetical protein
MTPEQALKPAGSSIAMHLSNVGIPALFVVLWSTGFIGARLGLPHAGPLTFPITRSPDSWCMACTSAECSSASRLAWKRASLR